MNKQYNPNEKVGCKLKSGKIDKKLSTKTTQYRVETQIGKNRQQIDAPPESCPSSCLYIEPFELVLEIVFHYCTTPPFHKTNLFKSPFRGSHFERLDDAFVLLISLIFLYLQNIRLKSRMYSIR